MDVLTLIETKVTVKRALKLEESILQYVEIPLGGFSGGISFLWRNNLEFRVNN